MNTANLSTEKIKALINKCNLQAEALKQKDAAIAEYEKTIAKPQSEKFAEFQEVEQAKPDQLFKCFQKVVLKMLENNDFIVPLKRTENNLNYEQVEHNIFIRYVKQIAGDEIEFINFCKSFGLIKVGTQKNIVFTGTSRGQQIRSIFIYKAAVNYIRELRDDVGEIFAGVQ